MLILNNPHQDRFLTKALPEPDFKYCSNCLTQSIFLKAEHTINFHGLSFLV